ncbi:MAG: phosphopantothenoylcysteine decarboxylase [Rickettsiales endosymbiont of Dermacentor nuttalli]
MTLESKKLTALVTAGPTQEKIDPVRFISNYSSGKQGYAIADALANYLINVHLVSGPTCLQPSPKVNVINVKTASQMLSACEELLPVDVAIFVAAVADFRAKTVSAHKIKKTSSEEISVTLYKNPDILKTISTHKTKRPKLVIGFAAETENLIENAKIKLQTKQCDWIIANSVTWDTSPFTSDDNEVYIITKDNIEHLAAMDKKSVGKLLAQKIIRHLN